MAAGSTPSRASAEDARGRSSQPSWERGQEVFGLVSGALAIVCKFKSHIPAAGYLRQQLNLRPASQVVIAPVVVRLKKGFKNGPVCISAGHGQV